MNRDIIKMLEEHERYIDASNGTRGEIYANELTTLADRSRGKDGKVDPIEAVANGFYAGFTAGYRACKRDLKRKTPRE